MKTTPPSYDDLIDLAARHQAGVERPGFETRLRARIAGLRRSRDEAGLFTAWLWRASWGLTPVAAALAFALFLNHGFGLPADADSALTQLAAWLPGIL